MSNALFCYPDRLLGSATYATALSGGSWNASYPLANLKDRLLSKVARSANAQTSSTTWDTDLGTARNLRALAILNSNLTTAATVQFRIYTDSGYSQLVFDTGALPMPWANLDAETLAGWRPDFWHALASDQSGRYVRTTVVDTANPAGYVELGRCLMLSAWQPQVNISHPNPLHYDHDATTIARSLGGVRFANRRTPLRVQGVELASATKDEAHQAVLEMQRRLGKDGELFFIHDPAEADFWVGQRSFLATMRELSPLDNPYTDRYRTAIVLEEVI